ncbi:hypothetical protein ACOI1C_06055 [Bacillus sp. DJP31]|uniref:hypothetical protein n=1 Tax=Bacillus sp. DJP31 TaxID=3409789 RepID=UPI003BB7A3D3
MKYTCLKDWDLKGEVYFKKNKSYKGRMVKTLNSNGVNTVKMVGENNMRIKFEEVSEYFIAQ